jgi:DNA helicase II / ATP-dependent DNA helicase PcrA
MSQFKSVIQEEEQRIQHIAGEMRATLAAEEVDRRQKDQELAELKRQKLEALGWREKREIDEQIQRCRAHYTLRHYQDSKALNQPYFGILELEDDDLGSLSYCIGPQSFFDRIGKALVIDWRDAPISRLYYEYEVGELYEEEIRKQDRSGVVRTKRQVDTTGGEVRKIKEKGILLLRREDGAWHRADDEGAVARKEEKADHRLPEITALISREQFQAITRPESGTVLLQGGAGSGKTTVGLHRIAYLAYQDPERFSPKGILVVMFNRSLQRYISAVLPGLGVEPGMHIETYHSWAAKIFRGAGSNISFHAETAPPEVTRFKKHVVILTVVDHYLRGLINKSKEWLLEQLDKGGEPDLGHLSEALENSAAFPDFFRTLLSHPGFPPGAQQEALKRIVQRLKQRLADHFLDLHAALTDREGITAALQDSSHEVPAETVDQLILWQTNLQGSKRIDFADAGILLWLMQQKGVDHACPKYAHIMIDEAQDLSEVELATLLSATDDRRSMTICGDMAQKIKGEVTFDDPEGFAGFIQRRQQRIGALKVHADTLVVGYRATRPIMELAWHVLGERVPMVVPRDGQPVRIIRTQNPEETATQAATILEAYTRYRPSALVCVVCRYKADADHIFRDLKRLGIQNIRRHSRDDFSFQPGIVVTNAHQVKGLEFSAVLVINPSAGQYRDDPESRMLLHVVITRAADQLWLIGHESMAYGLEKCSITNP